MQVTTNTSHESWSRATRLYHTHHTCDYVSPIRQITILTVAAHHMSETPSSNCDRMSPNRLVNIFCGHVAPICLIIPQAK